jgi:LysR family transcriptional regulator, benzoate and cis,cis-muconate-responsive activator of ben and cat genes
MELRQIRSFITLATELNFTRAAMRLHISQPPLTRQIQQLEREMGLALFARTTRGVSLTAAGTVFFEEAKKMIELADRAVEKSKLADKGQMGRLDIGIFGSSTWNVIPKLVSALRVSHPNIVISLQNTTKFQQIEAVRERRMDIGFNRVFPEIPDLVVETVFEEGLCVAMHKDHPLARRRFIAVKDLADEPIILFPNNVRPSFGDLIVAIYRNAGLTPNVVQDVEDVVTAIALVSSGMGLSIVPESAISLRLPDIRYHPLRAPGAKVDLSCVFHADNSSPTLRAFLEITRKMRRSKLRNLEGLINVGTA